MKQRVQFDFEIDFSNGGGIQGRDFRLDIAGDDISDRELAAYLVADMRLLMVGAVRIHNKRIVAEAHKRKPADTSSSSSRYVDLSHVIENGMVTHRGLPAPIICDYLSREASRTRYAPGTEFHIAKIEMVANTGTYIDCPFHRFADGRDFSQIGIEQLADIDAIVVRAEQSDSPAVGVQYFRGLEIRDRGPGLSREAENRAGRGFFSTKPAGIGTGLGLYVCLEIAQDHRGSVALVTRPTPGAIFRVELPERAPDLG